MSRSNKARGEISLFTVHKSILSASAAAIPSIAPLRHKVSFGAAAFELLVPIIFPFKPQFEPNHGAWVAAPTAVVVAVGVVVIKNPC
jgi:hypothetical protein